MKNKYYTPEIEEFHVGFDYEYFYKNSAWIKHTINTKADLILCVEENEENLIRVKYLDREDIESLEFNLDRISADKSQEIFFKDNIILVYNYSSKKLSIFTKDPSTDNQYLKICIDPYKVTDIEIKNKTELKKLLKQLHIIK